MRGVVVRVIGQSEISRQIASALEDAGFEATGICSLAVLADWPDVNALYGYAEEYRGPWILIEETDDAGAAIGPVFRPEGTGCFRCYIDRRRSNGGRDCRPLGRACRGMIRQIAGAVSAIANGRSSKEGEQLEILADGSEQSHIFLPLPNCTRCWTRLAPRRGLTIESLVDNRVGLVHELREITGLLEPLKMVVASGCRTDAFVETQALNRGMAVDDTLGGARERATGESIERYCGALAPERLPLAQVDELDGPSLSQMCFADREWDGNGHRRFRWVRATVISTGKDVWVPASLVYVPYTYLYGETYLGTQSSVGLAAGRSIDEAINHALAEITERDTCLRAWRYGHRVEKVATQPFPLDGLHLTRVPNASGLEVVVAFLERQRPPLTSTGLAARPSLADAARHATLEAVLSQIWLEDWLTNGEAMYSSPPRNMVDHAAAHALCQGLLASRWHWLHPSKVAETGLKPKSWSDIISRAPGASFVDVTTPDVDAAGVKVVRVLIPGRVTADDDALRPRLGGCAIPHPFG
jgi:ribosomal protein S12 methylthiotransferase accessory factor